LDPSHPPWPHSTRRPLVARKSLPNLERPQHVRPHQAGLPLRHEPRRLTSWTPPPTAARSLMRESNPDYNGVCFGEIETSNLEGKFSRRGELCSVFGTSRIRDHTAQAKTNKKPVPSLNYGSPVPK